MYDVTIIGAGAAGASAAYFLNNAGLKTLVIEKQELPRYKACGGGLSLVFLKQQFPFSFEPVIERNIRQISYSYWGKRTTIPIHENVMGMFMRERFDNFILSHADCDITQNSTVNRVEEKPQHVIVHTKDGKKIESRFLIAADGANSIVRKSMRFPARHRLAPAIETEIPITAQNRHLAAGPDFIFEGPRYGYFWIFPKRDFLSVGIVNLKAQKINMPVELRQMMAAKGLVLNGAKLNGHGIPLYRPGSQISSKRILLAGDAAGLVDPISGEGIRPAIKSGRLAAEAIIEGRLESYPISIEKMLSEKLFKSHIVSKVFYPLREICLTLGAPNPISTHTVLRTLSDQGSYLRVLTFSFGSLPYFIPMELAARMTSMIAGEKTANRFRNKVFPGNY